MNDDIAKLPDDVMNRFRLDGRSAVVTGGTRGIGRAISLGLMQAGAKVAVTCQSLGEGSENFVNDMVALGYEPPVVLTGDVASPDDVKRIADGAFRELGTVSILVNNAGINIVGASETYPVNDFDRLMDVNFKGVFLCSQAFGAHMLGSGGGSIINVGSMSADIVNRPAKQAIYNASKAAVHMLSKCLAVEWADRKVRVNVIAPGFHATDMVKEVMAADPDTKEMWLSMVPQGRVADPSELAGAAVYLASDASSYSTGGVITLDGGYTLL